MLKPIRRVVTAHNAQGKSIIASDDSVDRVRDVVTELAPHIVPVAIDEAGLTCMRIGEGDQT